MTTDNKRDWGVAVMVVALLLGGCTQVRYESAPPTASATMAGDGARPAAAQWLRTELYFAVGQVEDVSTGRGISEATWQAFLDREVTSRFPDGLTVFDAYGQWRQVGGDRIGRLRSKVIVILHEDTPEKRALIDDVRAAFKQQTGQQSVLRATAPVEVSF